jgi:hypothetical protein
MIIVTVTEDNCLYRAEIDVQILGILEKKVGERTCIKEDSSQFIFELDVD